MDLGQALLLGDIATCASSVMVFGDPAQAVFGFIGGKFHDMKDILGKVKVLPLSRSFRLTHETAALANAISTKSGVTIVGSRDGKKPAFTRCTTAREQEDAVVAIVEELKASGVPGDNIAVLARTKAQLRQIEQALLASGHMINAVNGREQPEHMERMLDLLAMLNRNVARLHGQLPPMRKLKLERKLTTLCELENVPKAVIQKCRRRFQRAALAPSFSGRYAAVKSLYITLVGTVKPAVKKSVLIELNRWQAISDGFRTVKSLRAFVREMRHQPSIASSTIHGAKGDEWEHVIVAGLTQGSLPFYRELKRGDIEEERRLFYVAVTRAIKRTYLIAAPFYHAPSRQPFDEPSEFLTSKVRRALRPCSFRISHLST
jgi:DNA helicase II / ATP-dependent DNA helicase PcrA